MKRFQYTARDESGSVVRSSVHAASRVQALSELRKQGLTVVDLFSPEEAQAEKEAISRKAVKKKSDGLAITSVGLPDIAEFSRLLATSVSAGVPLRDALESISEDVEKPALRKIMTKIISKLHEGKSFSEALAAFPKTFSNLFISMVRSAEESGSMPSTLDQLAVYLERYERLRRKIRSITAYPIFIVVFFCLVCVIMTLFVLPQFQDAFSSFDAELPALTVAVFNINTFVLNHKLHGAALFVGLVVFFLVLRRLPAGRHLLDRIKLRLPFFGLIIRKFSIARLSRNLAVMIRGGVPITTALEITASVSENKVLEESLIRVKERIMTGSDISTSLRADPEFPRLFVRMVDVGESSGQLPQVLEKLSDVYEERVEGQIEVATSLFEPVIICVFGVIVLVLILAIYMPVFTMSSAVN